MRIEWNFHSTRAGERASLFLVGFRSQLWRLILCVENEKKFGAFENDGRTYEFNFQLEKKCNELCSKSLLSRTHFFPTSHWLACHTNLITYRDEWRRAKINEKKSQQPQKCIEIVAGELPRLIWRSKIEQNGSFKVLSNIMCEKNVNVKEFDPSIWWKW